MSSCVESKDAALGNADSEESAVSYRFEDVSCSYGTTREVVHMLKLPCFRNYKTLFLLE